VKSESSAAAWYIRRAVSGAPPFTDAQRARLRAVLAPAAEVVRQDAAAERQNATAA
jgi:hypothetical protein